MKDIKRVYIVTAEYLSRDDSSWWIVSVHYSKEMAEKTCNYLEESSDEHYYYEVESHLLER